MPHDQAPLHRARVRGTDSNSLLRMYDAAKHARTASVTQRDRAAADQALRAITRELAGRGVRV